MTSIPPRRHHRWSYFTVNLCVLGIHGISVAAVQDKQTPRANTTRTRRLIQCPRKGCMIDEGKISLGIVLRMRKRNVYKTSRKRHRHVFLPLWDVHIASNEPIGAENTANCRAVDSSGTMRREMPLGSGVRSQTNREPFAKAKYNRSLMLHSLGQNYYRRTRWSLETRHVEELLWNEHEV